MGNFPWGPHGPERSPNQIKPNATPSDPVGGNRRAGLGDRAANWRGRSLFKRRGKPRDGFGNSRVGNLESRIDGD